MLALSENRRGWGGRTIFLGVGGASGRVRRGNHLAGLHGDLHEEVMDVLEVWFCHFLALMCDFRSNELY